MSEFNDLTALFLLALLIERLVELIFSPLVEALHVKWPDLIPREVASWLMKLLSLTPGVVAAFAYDLDIISSTLSSNGVSELGHTFGLVITGLSIGAGANFLHNIYPKKVLRSGVKWWQGGTEQG